MNKDAKVYVAGHQGMVGAALVRLLEKRGYTNIVVKSHKELDLVDQDAVQVFFEAEKPEYVFLAAGLGGGFFFADEHPAEVVYQNLQIQTNVIDQASQSETKRLLFLGCSSCYPKHAMMPLKETALLTGPILEEKLPFVIAKMTGIRMIETYNAQYSTDYLSVLPSNLYGPGDRFDSEQSHIVAKIMGEMHRAKSCGEDRVEFWGTGEAERDFLHVDDLAQACLLLMDQYHGSVPVNLATGSEVTISDLANLIAKKVGFEGEIIFDKTKKADGMLLNRFDLSRIEALGWKAEISLEEGLAETYDWYKKSLV